MQDVSASCRSSVEECKKALEMVKGLLHQNGIEKFWQQWILRQMGIQTSQSENSTTVLLSHAPKQNSKVSHTASTQATHSRASGPGNVVNKVVTRVRAFPESVSHVRTWPG